MSKTRPPQDEKGLSHLPPADTQRWVKSRKLAVVKAIENNLLTSEAACSRYNLSAEELESWKRLFTRYGAEALRTTHLKRYRAQDTLAGGSDGDEPVHPTS